MKALVALLGLIMSAFSTVEAAPFADTAVKTPPMVVALTQALTLADGVPPDMDVYDAASWSAPGPSSGLAPIA